MNKAKVQFNDGTVVEIKHMSLEIASQFVHWMIDFCREHNLEVEYWSKDQEKTED